MRLIYQFYFLGVVVGLILAQKKHHLHTPTVTVTKQIPYYITTTIRAAPRNKNNNVNNVQKKNMGLEKNLELNTKPKERRMEFNFPVNIVQAVDMGRRRCTRCRRKPTCTTTRLPIEPLVSQVMDCLVEDDILQEDNCLYDDGINYNEDIGGYYEEQPVYDQGSNGNHVIINENIDGSYIANGNFESPMAIVNDHGNVFVEQAADAIIENNGGFGGGADSGAAFLGGGSDDGGAVFLGGGSDAGSPGSPGFYVGSGSGVEATPSNPKDVANIFGPGSGSGSGSGGGGSSGGSYYGGSDSTYIAPTGAPNYHIYDDAYYANLSQFTSWSISSNTTTTSTRTNTTTTRKSTSTKSSDDSLSMETSDYLKMSLGFVCLVPSLYLILIGV